MSRKLEPRTLGAVFGGYFAIIAIASVLHAMSLTSVWYLPDITRFVFAVYMIASAALLAGVAAAAVSRTQFLERRIIEINKAAGNADVVEVTAAAAEVSEGLPPPLLEEPPKDQADRDIDDLLESLSEMEVTTVEQAEEVEAGPAPATLAALGTMDGSLRAKLEKARKARRAVPRYLAGPAAGAVFVLGVSAAMLPAADGMLQSYHQLNTALILGVGYGWLGLGAYIGASVLSLVRQK